MDNKEGKDAVRRVSAQFPVGYSKIKKVCITLILLVKFILLHQSDRKTQPKPLDDDFFPSPRTGARALSSQARKNNNDKVCHN